MQNQQQRKHQPFNEIRAAPIRPTRQVDNVILCKNTQKKYNVEVFFLIFVLFSVVVFFHFFCFVCFFFFLFQQCREKGQEGECMGIIFNKPHDKEVVYNNIS